MKSEPIQVSGLVRAVVFGLLIFGVTASAMAQHETVLYTFTGEPDGQSPYGPVVSDRSGNLYGTTSFGGAFNVGMVYKLTRPTTAHGAWTETVLYSLGATAGDGTHPQGGLVFDSKGNLYGTASGGGTLGGGNVF